MTGRTGKRRFLGLLWSLILKLAHADSLSDCAVSLRLPLLTLCPLASHLRVAVTPSHAAVSLGKCRLWACGTSAV